MSALRDAAIGLAEALGTEDVPAYSFPPSDVVLPCVVIQPAENYVGDRETFGGEFPVALEVYLALELNDPEQAVTDLDQLLESFLTNLPGEWGIDSMRQPGPFHTADWLAYGLPITVSRFISL